MTDLALACRDYCHQQEAFSAGVGWFLVGLLVGAVAMLSTRRR